MTPLKIDYIAIEKLKPFLGNPRKNDESVDAVVKSIEAFGYTNPILVRRENNEIIAGHTRLKALQKMGAEQAPVIYLDLNETDARVYSVFDNKSVENAEWDFPKLADLLVEFDQLNVDLDLTGFDENQIKSVILGPTNPYEEWEGMPEFNNEDLTAYRQIIISFRNEEDIQEFSKLIEQNITEYTKSVWFPKVEIDTMMNKQYTDES